MTLVRPAEWIVSCDICGIWVIHRPANRTFDLNADGAVYRCLYCQSDRETDTDAWSFS